VRCIQSSWKRAKKRKRTCRACSLAWRYAGRMILDLAKLTHRINFKEGRQNDRRMHLQLLLKEQVLFCYRSVSYAAVC
jgi:hypothetical protein